MKGKLIFKRENAWRYLLLTNEDYLILGAPELVNARAALHYRLYGIMLTLGPWTATPAYEFMRRKVCK